MCKGNGVFGVQQMTVCLRDGAALRMPAKKQTEARIWLSAFIQNVVKRECAACEKAMRSLLRSNNRAVLKKPSCIPFREESLKLVNQS